MIVVSAFIGPGWLPEQLGSLQQGRDDEDDEDYHNGSNRYIQSQA